MGNFNIYRQLIGFEADKTAGDILADLTGLIEQHPLGVNVFFNYFNGRNCCMTSLFSAVLSDFDSPEGFIDYLEGSDARVLCGRVLAYYDSYRNTDDFYNDLLCDAKRLAEFLALNHELHGLRIDLIAFLANPGDTLRNLIYLFKNVLPMTLKIHELNTERIRSFVQTQIEGFSMPVFTLPGHAKEIKVDTSGIDEMVFSVSLMNEYGCFLLRRAPKIFLCVGMKYDEAREVPGYNEHIDPSIIGKALSDELRFDIFEMLNKKDMYLTEIAAALALPPPAVSYHINFLVNARL
ncbi:MAG: winged helix-turn-helix domain-containing protein, partial [Clostridia bacterium]|nr:winged helix-turn-helix domain-containing protein [Clostridia bacterium]